MDVDRLRALARSSAPPCWLRCSRRRSRRSPPAASAAEAAPREDPTRCATPTSATSTSTPASRATPSSSTRAPAPDDAYRYAKGEAIQHAGGFEVKLSGEPLDFLAVTDHGEYLGVFSSFTDGGQPAGEVPFAQRVLAAADAPEIRATFQAMRELRVSGELAQGARGLGAGPQVGLAGGRSRRPSATTMPGKFTTFIGYEYTSAPDVAEPAPQRDLPRQGRRAAVHARRTRATPRTSGPGSTRGAPRASRRSPSRTTRTARTGRCSALETFDGEPLDAAYAELRMRNEPLVEVTQIKGTSETHPMLSPNDEWANFEIMTLRIATTIPSDIPGSYVARGLRQRPRARAGRAASIRSSSASSARATPTTRRARSTRTNYFSKVGKMDDDAGRARLGAAAIEPPREAASATPTSTTTCGARRVSPACGRRRTRASRSTTRCGARRPSPPAARACACASSPATTSPRASRAIANAVAAAYAGRRADGRRPRSRAATRRRASW